MKIHRGDRPYKSMECGKHFSVHSHLAVHEKLQAAEKHLVCEACGQKFQLLTEWKAHQKSHVTLGSLQGHSWFRSEEKRAAGRTIKLEMSYENGGKSSGNENDSFARVTDSVVECSSTAQTAHMCNMCGKTFQARRRLVEHERIHTGEKPFSCSECGRRFSSRSQLTRHLRSHTEEKPYICTVCGMSVTHWSDMTVHQRMHVGETLHTASEGYLKEIKKERFIKTESPKEDPLRETLEEWIWHEQNATGATVPERNEAVERTFSSEGPEREIKEECPEEELIKPAVIVSEGPTWNGANTSTWFQGCQRTERSCRWSFQQTQAVKDEQCVHTEEEPLAYSEAEAPLNEVAEEQLQVQIVKVKTPKEAPRSPARDAVEGLMIL
uniref:Zinc finger protein 184-like isoform X2 n=1 Tax=Geotrypetes seraphini TaxID=260995 RepID=A0A6P8QMK5_GEOSA|nr:zinc finger protein 184-like isoform X2 [Geotrypetes seraphini]